MKERIRELAAGRVETACPVVKVMPERLEGQLELEGVHKASFWVETENSVAVKGVIYSSHSRVAVTRSTFYGRNCEIIYTVNTVALSGQAIIDGEFTLVTNAGVYQLPFVFHMTEPVFGTNNRPLRSLEDYALLVQEEPETAYRLFRSKTFMQLPILKNIDQTALYQTLRSDHNTPRGVEEFLAKAGVKASLVFHIQGDSVKNYNDLQEDVQSEIILEKNTWGYGELHVSCDAEYIDLSCTEITSDMFTENRLAFSYVIRADLLAMGTNVCQITFATAKGMLTYRICITQQKQIRFSDRSGLLRKRSSVLLTQYFVNYRIARSIGAKETAEEALKQLELYLQQLVGENADEWQYQLMRIYVYLKQGRPEEADLLLDTVREQVMQNRLTNVRCYCFFLYLRAVFYESKEQMETAASLINKYYTEEGQDPMLLFLLLEVDVSLQENKSLALLRLKECYKNGCRSPLLYLAACENYQSQPDLLRVLNAFELQVVYFGARRGMLTEEMAVEVARAAGHELQYKAFTYRLLHFLYQKYPTDSMLEMLCGYLIRSGCIHKRFFPCYEQGVLRRLGLVSLNEYFMYSLPEDYCKPLPQELLLYFTYSNNMRDDLQEVLYENVLLYYPEDSQVYREYSNMMEEYALTKLLEGRISRKLVPLYRHLVVQEMIDARLARVLPNLLMAYEFVCENRRMEKMVLRYPELNYEDTYLLEQGMCCAPVFMDNCMVFFIDEFGHRYCDIPYTKELLFQEEASPLLTKCEEVYPEHFMFRLRRCKLLLRRQNLKEEDVVLLKDMLNVAELNGMFKTKIISKLLDYNLQQDDIDASLLHDLDVMQMKYNDRRKTMECLIRLGNYETAYSYVKYFGVNGLRYDSLLKLLQHTIQAAANDDNCLLYLCLYLFAKEIYSPATLAYLCSYYNGPSDTMYQVLQATQQAQLPCFDLPERILAQKLFSGDWVQLDELFRIYNKSGSVNELLEQAYYVICSYRYFVLSETPEQWVFDRLEQVCMEKGQSYEDIDICNIALLYHYSQCDLHLPEQLEHCSVLLDRLCKKGLLFGFYSKLWQKVSCPAELNGKFLLEYRSREAKRVFLHSRFLGETQETVHQMEEMYSGIFVSQVVLFADETLSYSVYEEDSNGEQRIAVENEVLANDMSFVRQGSVFDTINTFSRYQATGQDKRLEEAMIDREAKQEVIRRLFGTISG